jgi:ribosomal protein L32E
MAIKKKGHPTFNVPNFGSKSRSRVKARWRKQRGIDNKKREKMDFMGAEPTIGYRNPESLRGVRGAARGSCCPQR